MYPYMRERVMRQFAYLQIISRPPYESSPLGVLHRDLVVILDDFESHLVREGYRLVSAHVHWAYVDDYMTWF